jgi:hypothetical protein
MLIPNLPEHSRVWVFAANRILEESDLQDVKLLMNSFIAQWQSHGTDLLAGFQMMHDCLLVVAVDQSVEAPSGCSIDKVFRLLNQTNIDFFQRTLLWVPFCNSAKIITQEQAILQYKVGELNDESLVINTLAETLSQARNQLYIPLKDSWIYQKIKRYNQYEG